MNTADVIARLIPNRKIEGHSAILLPYTEDGHILWDAFEAHVRRTHEAGLGVAANMDTGYANYLTIAEKEEVLRRTRDVLGEGVPFIAGAYIENLDGEMVALYHQEIERIQAVGATPILFQTARMKGLKGTTIAEFYKKIVAPCERALAFELGEMFAPNGAIYDLDTVQALMEIPQITGMKHSSLNREMEWQRLALRDRVRPGFKVYTGNDLAIDMVMHGSDYLLGLSTFCPELFAQRDAYWENGDPRFYELNDQLQHLGNVGFRAPVPAYKHSAAIFLHLTGKIPTPHAHPQCPNRPEYETDILRDCAVRLGKAPFDSAQGDI